MLVLQWGMEMHLQIGARVCLDHDLGSSYPKQLGHWRRLDDPDAAEQATLMAVNYLPLKYLLEFVLAPVLAAFRLDGLGLNWLRH